MLRWICAKTRSYMIRNENIRERIAVTPIAKKICKIRLIRWFVHVERTHVDYVVRILVQMKNTHITRGR